MRGFHSKCLLQATVCCLFIPLPSSFEMPSYEFFGNNSMRTNHKQRRIVTGLDALQAGWTR